MTEEQVFLAALDIPEATARAAYLDETCGKDGGFRRQVEALLAFHFRSGEFLDVPAAEQLKAGSTDANTVTIQGDGAKNAEESDGLTFLTPSKRPDSLGRIGHYEVLEVLGRGGFGIVFRAFDEVLQRVVAVKVMAPEIATTSPARKRFLREARSSAQVRHENVVHVYEVVEHPLPYLVMEFIPGETLQQRLDRVGPLEVSEVLRIGRQIAEGLAAAHATDLIHRDIKPSNVLLEGGAQQRAKITDFGLARAADDASISQSGIIAGTPMYMAPEQALGHKLDQRADLFSFGSVLYQMTCGRPPFRANSTVAVLKRVAEDTPRPIREIIPEVPEWFCRIVEKLHAKNPAERFQTSREVGDVLADCETQLKTHGQMRNFARIPGGGKSPVKSKYRRLATKLCGVAALLWAAVLFGEPAYRYAANQAAIEVVPESGLTSISIHRDGQAVTDWYDAETRPTITLPPGKYKLEPGFAPGRTVERWELRTRSTFSSRTEWQGVRAPEFEVARGEQVTVRAVMRDEPATDPMPPTVSDGFVSLFNGTDLTGWKAHPQDHGVWNVEDGAIVGRNGESYLFTEKGDFDDFHLRVEAKINSAGDAGVVFRSGFEVRPKKGGTVEYSSGYEAQINLRQGWPVHTGSLCRALGEGEPAAEGVLQKGPLNPHRPDDWFLLEIIARGNHIQLLVNGKPTATYFDRSTTYKRGHFALQNWSGVITTVHFRKIEIKELPPSSPEVPKEAADVLPFLAGTWKGEFTQKIYGSKPAEKQFTAVAVNDWIVGQKWLRQRVHMKDGGFLSLVSFEPGTMSFRDWFFHARGLNFGPSTGRWDSATRTMTWTNLPENGVVLLTKWRFVDADTVAWEILIRDKEGQTVFELASRMKRTAETVTIDESTSAGPLPPEMAALDKLIGDWEITGITKNAENPDGLKATWPSASRRILGGRIIAAQSTGHPGAMDAYSLSTFDTFSKSYARWLFKPDGTVLEYGGGWDEKTQTMKWNWAGKDGSQSTNTWRFVGPDRTDWQVVTKNAVGKTMLDFQATSVRQLPGTRP